MTTNSKQIKINIGGKVFHSNKWNIFKAADNLPKVGKTFAVPVSFIYSAMEESNLKEAIPQAIYMLFEQLEEQDIKSLFEVILDDVHADNGSRKVDIENDFVDLDQVLELTAAVLEQQYGGMLKGKGFSSLFKMLMPLHQTQ
jgi:hypothetical protein